MSKHTPGPWAVLKNSGMDAIVRCPDGRSFNCGDTVYHRDNEANARLIAAAPDLLEALIALDTVLDFSRGIRNGEEFVVHDPSKLIQAFVMACKAIQRAEGEQ